MNRCPLTGSVTDELPNAPPLERRLVFPPRRAVILLLLLALPVASCLGAFRKPGFQSATAKGLSLRVQYPQRTLYREEERIELELVSQVRCQRAVVDGMSSYLERFEHVHVSPSPRTAQRLYDGPLERGETLRLLIQASPVEIGASHATVRTACDANHGPELALTTFVFP